VTIQPGRTARQFWAAADEALTEAAFRTGEFAEAERLFGVGLVFQVLRRDWAAAMPYFWPSFGLAEAVEESGDLTCCRGGLATPSRVCARPSQPHRR
jgi:hypothetical protein